MSEMKGKAGMVSQLEPDMELEQALANFRQSVHAWSEAEFNRPRTVHAGARSGWQPALAWALGCVVAAGAAGGGVYEHHRVVVERQVAEARLQHQRELAAQQKAREADQNLLANVDTDISRSVPEAMEPLAELMEDNGTN